jgi:hypothetical protein
MATAVGRNAEGIRRRQIREADHSVGVGRVGGYRRPPERRGEMRRGQQDAVLARDREAGAGIDRTAGSGSKAVIGGLTGCGVSRRDHEPQRGGMFMTPSGCQTQGSGWVGAFIAPRWGLMGC